jgi:hypothetical protein
LNATEPVKRLGAPRNWPHLPARRCSQRMRIRLPRLTARRNLTSLYFILECSLKYVDTLRFCFKSGNDDGHFTRRPTRISARAS